ncbi:MAG: shikimate kinase [Thermoguttaceae bacterium]
MNLILIGYRGTGKTTLARLLAQRLDWQWVDADVQIEKIAGKSITKIFAEDGEPAFRDVEARVIAEQCAGDNLLLATGGGAPMREESRRAMRRGGTVVWLTARPETILARMSGDATTAERRPSLTDRGPLREIIQMLDRRDSTYRQTAHLEIDTEGKTPQELADEIIERTRLAPRAEES